MNLISYSCDVMCVRACVFAFEYLIIWLEYTPGEQILCVCVNGTGLSSYDHQHSGHADSIEASPCGTLSSSHARTLRPPKPISRRTIFVVCVCVCSLVCRICRHATHKKAEAPHARKALQFTPYKRVRV